MKRILAIFICIITVMLLMCGCAKSNIQNTTETQATSETSPNNVNNESLNDMLKIYEESMEDNISLYCENYLTYKGNPFKNLESIEDVITDEHYKKIKSTENYQSDDKDYEQATALNCLYYGEYSTPSDTISVLAQCYQSVIVDNKSTTYNTFYIFNMKYDEQNGWLIDSVEKPSNEYLEG